MNGREGLRGCHYTRTRLIFIPNQKSLWSHSATEENSSVFYEVGINSVFTPQAQDSCTTILNTNPANLVLQSTVERVFVPPPCTSLTSSTPTGPGLYADIPKGIFLVRGENVLLLGEIDLDKDDDPPPGYERAEVEVVHKLAKEKKTRDAKKDKSRLKKLGELGFEGENLGETLL